MKKSKLIYIVIAILLLFVVFLPYISNAVRISKINDSLNSFCNYMDDSHWDWFYFGKGSGPGKDRYIITITANIFLEYNEAAFELLYDAISNEIDRLNLPFNPEEYIEIHFCEDNDLFHDYGSPICWVRPSGVIWLQTE